jgi:hypothetical protein
MKSKEKNNRESYESGYRLFYRSIIEHPYVGFEKPYKRSEAWLWLIFSAWGDLKKKGEILIDKKLFILEYGEMVYSIRFLAQAWGWGDKKVRNFLAKLEKLSQITRKTTQQTTRITICNLKDYQNRGHSKGRTEGEQRANRGRTEGTNTITISRNHYANSNGEFHKMQKWIWEKLPHVSKMEEQLSYSDAEKLIADFDKEIILEVLEAMENYKGIEKRNTNVNLTTRNWIRRRLKDTNGRKDPTDDEIERTWGKKL